MARAGDPFGFAGEADRDRYLTAVLSRSSASPGTCQSLARPKHLDALEPPGERGGVALARGVALPRHHVLMCAVERVPRRRVLAAVELAEESLEELHRLLLGRVYAAARNRNGRRRGEGCEDPHRAYSAAVAPV